MLAQIVYICSPFKGDIETNITNAIGYSGFVYTQGYIPITPHCIFNELNGVSHILAECNELWSFGDLTPRMRSEVAAARTMGLEVRHFDRQCNSLGYQGELFKMLYNERLTSGQYLSIPEISRQIQISPSDYCHYFACTKKASSQVVVQTISVLAKLASSNGLKECI